jgi:hypothetical protein
MSRDESLTSGFILLRYNLWLSWTVECHGPFASRWTAKSIHKLVCSLTGLSGQINVGLDSECRDLNNALQFVNLLAPLEYLQYL